MKFRLFLWRARLLGDKPLTTGLSNFHRNHSTDSKPRLRFAPSPTGMMHLGGLRTALYNYLMCRRTGGTFVLRVEDTDQTRLVPGAVDNIQDSLEWMGLTPDEGPRYGGPFAPYVQSERLELYKDAAEKLIEAGAAYRCYCSPLRLEVMRKAAVKQGEHPKYDNRCRSIIPNEETAKQPHVVRLKMDPRVYHIQDEVYGPVSLRVDMEGDPVILKSDGFPTYHLASVVDDHHMKISHVLRGIEWQSSTPKHLQIYESLGWTPPRFAHLPLLMNPDGTKFSKRKGALEILEYRQQGMYPEAVINLLVQVGGGFSSGVAHTNRLFSLEELIQTFDLKLVNRNSCQLNYPKLADYNRQALAARLSSPTEKEKFVQDVCKVYQRKYATTVNEAVVRHVIDWAQSRLTNMYDLFTPDMEFVWSRKDTSTSISVEARPSLSAVTDLLGDIPKDAFLQADIAKLLRRFADESGSDFKKLMHLLRLALCGGANGPSVAEMCEILGREEVVERLKCAVRNSDTSTGVRNHAVTAA